MNKEKNTAKGITLIALVITIIVMLILVAVTISMALNGGLFGYAKDATTKTKSKMEAESQLASGRIKIGGVWYDSLQDYVDNKPSQDQSDTSKSTDNKIDYPVNDKIEFTYVDNGDGTASITSIKSLDTSKGTNVGTYQYEFYLNTDTLVLPSKTSEGKSITEVRISEPIPVSPKFSCIGYVKDVKTIVFNSGIQKINGTAKDFAYFKEVTKVIIPDTVTEISADAFSCIDSNFEISFPLGVNKALQIPENKWGAETLEIKNGKEYTWEKYSFELTAVQEANNYWSTQNYTLNNLVGNVTAYAHINFDNKANDFTLNNSWTGNYQTWLYNEYKNYPFTGVSGCYVYQYIPNSVVNMNNQYTYSVKVHNVYSGEGTISKGSYKYGEVQSTDPTAYPQDGFKDGYWYVLKQS